MAFVKQFGQNPNEDNSYLAGQLHARMLEFYCNSFFCTQKDFGSVLFIGYSISCTEINREEYFSHTER